MSMLQDDLRSPRPPAEIPHVMYHLKVALWDRRRRRLARRLKRKGATTYEVLTALRVDATRHPHPR